MNKIYHKFLIAFVVFTALGGFYVYFSNSLESEASLLSSLESSISKDSISSDDKINTDIAFISTLESLNNLKIDSTFFTNKAFKSLKDNTVRLEPVNPGRLNPFSPITGGNMDSEAVSFETN